MNTMEVKKHNATISVFRALAAFFVVTQHVPYRGSLEIVNYFMTTAVPFFFLVAGYFSWNHDEKIRAGKILKHMKKVALIYCAGYLFYYIMSVALKYAVNSLFHKNTMIEFENWNLLELGKGLLLDIDPFASHLWFLYAMIFVYLMLWIFHFKGMLYPGLIVAVVFFFLGKTQLFDFESFATIKRAVTVNFALVFLGYWTHAMEEKGVFHKRNFLLCSLVGLILIYIVLVSCLQDIFVGNGYSEYVAMAAFLIAIKYKHIGERNLLDRIGEQYTLGIYVLHIFVMHMWERVMSKVPFLSHNFFVEIHVVIVYVLTLFLVKMLCFVRNKWKKE